MKIIVTIINGKTNQGCDIQIDNQQKIQTTIRVLRDNIPQIFGEIENPIELQSYRSKRKLLLSQTYEEACIYSGDQLRMS